MGWTQSERGGGSWVRVCGVCSSGWLRCVWLLRPSRLPRRRRSIKTPPNLTVNIKPLFVVGSVVDRDTTFPVEYAVNIAQSIQWSATDNVGVCSYDLFATPAGADPEPLLQFSQDTQFTFQAGDYNGDFGGGSFVIDGFTVTARDCQGNATTKVVSEVPVVNQEDGQSATGPSGTLAYSGSWATTTCACFLWQRTQRTSQNGARVTFTRTYEQGDQVALVMALGPGRGKASIPDRRARSSRPSTRSPRSTRIGWWSSNG